MHIQSLAHEFLKGKEINLTVIILQELKDFVKLQDSDFDPEFLKMLKDYFDPGIISESYKVGKISAILGFDEGRLPLVCLTIVLTIVYHYYRMMIRNDTP